MAGVRCGGHNPLKKYQTRKILDNLLMKIGIDARMFGSGFGLARYVQQLVLHFEKIDCKNQYVIFLLR